MNSSAYTPPLLLVVCTGNVCRSPMAEAVLLKQLHARGLAANVLSRGLAAPIGRPPHPFAVEVCASRGLALNEAKRAEALVSAEVAASLIILVMDNGHRREIERRFPTALGKTFLLGQWESIEIQDPINQPRTSFLAAMQQIEIGVESWVSRLEGSGMLKRLATM